MPKAITGDKLAQLTPFARALQEWMWRDNYPPIQTRVELAERLGIARSTVESWFGSKRVLPVGRGYHRVLEVTGWPEEKMLELTGYQEAPPENPDVWDFARDAAPARWGYDPGLLAQIVTWLNDLQGEYRKRSTTRPRVQQRRQTARRKAQQPAEATPTPATQPTPAPATARREREKVGSGK